MPVEPFILAADAVVPMDPSLPRVLMNAGVVVNGDRIIAVGELSDLRQSFGKAQVQQHKGTLLPGFINAHTHLELSYQDPAGLDNSHFTRWVASLISRYPPPEQLEAVTRAAVRKGVAASLRAGVTTLGDISRHCKVTRDELGRIPPGHAARVVSYGEIVALGTMRHRVTEMLEAALPPPVPPPPDPEQAKRDNQASYILPVTLPPGLLIIGVSPHAPYTVEGPALRKVVSRALVRNVPIAMHLAELADEDAFLRDQTGPLGIEWDLMLKMDILDDKIPQFPATGHGTGGPIRWAQRWGLIIADKHAGASRTFPILLAHVNYCDNSELAQLAASSVSIAYCPRTHGYFKHPPHRYRDMLAAGINVCLGTDSLASNPDLSVLREAQLLHQRDGLDAHIALEMITRRGAIALGLGEYTGILSPDKYADMIILPTTARAPEDLLREILAAAPDPVHAWISGVSAVPAPS